MDSGEFFGVRKDSSSWTAIGQVLDSHWIGLDSHWTGPGFLDSHWTGLGLLDSYRILLFALISYTVHIPPSRKIALFCLDKQNMFKK